MTNKTIFRVKTMTNWILQHLSAGVLVILFIAVFVIAYSLGRGPGPVDATNANAQRAGHDLHDGPKDQADSSVKTWICSMHPQIRMPTPGNCPICQMKLVPATGGDSADGLRQLSITPAAAKMLDIQTSPVERKYVDRSISMVGKIDYDETRIGYITAYVGGRLDRLFVDYTGVSVKTGQHMVEIYSPELIAAQEELIQALEAVKALQDSNVGIVKETAESTVKTIREKLRLWGLTKEQIAAVETRGKPSDQITINSPLSGIVIHKNAQEGMYVQTGTRIYTIADLTTLWVKFDAYESDLMWLRFGQPVEFTTEAYSGEVFKGKIAFIDPVLDDTRRTVKVRVNVTNEDGRLKPGMFVRGTVTAHVAMGGRIFDDSLAGKWISPMHPEIVKDKPGFCDKCGMPLVKAETLGYVSPLDRPTSQPLVVPASAVLITGRRAIVYVKVSGDDANADRPIFEGREIVLGARAGDYYIVRSNLREGEQVVTKGNFKLDSELQIRAKLSMMTPDGGGGSGHNHGGHGSPKKADAGATSMAGMQVPPIVLDQWQNVEQSLHLLTEVLKDDDIERVAQTYRRLHFALQDIDVNKLAKAARPMWNELAMRLTNDIVEGSDAPNVTEARRLLLPLNVDLAKVRKMFALFSRGETHDTVPIPKVFAASFEAVLQSYFDLSEALAADDYQKGKTTGTALSDAFNQIDANSLATDAAEFWIPASKRLNQAIGTVKQATKIDELRSAFLPLSQELASLTIAFSESLQFPVYTMHCPMAFNNKGGSWLSSQRKVYNPYFGSQMLRCGDVTGTLVFDPSLLKSSSPLTTNGQSSSAAPVMLFAGIDGKQIAPLSDAYFKLSNTLVLGDMKQAKTAIRFLLDAISNVTVNSDDGNVTDTWTKLKQSLQASAIAMQNAKDIEGMRKHFATLSEEMAVVIKSAGGAAMPVFQVKCPMALDNRGATWLQSNKTIANPYFGDRMLRCGSVVGTIHAQTLKKNEGHQHD